ncbi:MAG: hypothetical protein ACUVXI_02720 [bacterium]
MPNPKLNVTHAVTIHAPVAEVWPWLVQMGQGRGGFYSYEWIENLMGLDIHNANRIVQEFQNLKVGDRIPLAPGGFGIPVAALEPGRAFVLHGDTRTDTFTIPITGPGDYFNVSWGFYLDEIDGRNARLIERWRVDWNPRPQNWMYIRAFLEPSAFLMERKMLLGIKQRAESFGRGSALPK